MRLYYDSIKELSVTVMGLGIHGGGLASARFFAELGAKEVIITDLKTEQELAPSVNALQMYPNVRLKLGRHEKEDFMRADIVVKNPAVKRAGNPFLAVARRIETDISLFLQYSESPLIAVTGSKGKSSTASAVHHGLHACGIFSFLGGNITVSPLTFVFQAQKETPVVLELSSWQLGDLKTCHLLKPHIAVLTPVMPDHLNWYGSMDRYVADKKIIYQNQTASDYTICNYDDEWGSVFASETKAAVYWYSKNPLPEHLFGVWIASDGTAHARLPSGGTVTEHVLLPRQLTVPGAIFKQNLMTAALVLALYGVPPEKIPITLSSYSGIPHRMEFFHKKGETTFFNDSAATIPHATAAAIAAFEIPVVLIAGGTDKHLDFTTLAPQLASVSQIYLLAGSATDKLLPLLDHATTPYAGPFNSFEDLLTTLARHLDTSKKQAVVLSPGAASFGLFKNEFDRGNRFKAAVRRLF